LGDLKETREKRWRSDREMREEGRRDVGVRKGRKVE